MSVTTATFIDEPAVVSVVSVVSDDDESEEDPQPAATRASTTAKTAIPITERRATMTPSFRNACSSILCFRAVHFKRRIGRTAMPEVPVPASRTARRAPALTYGR